MTHYQVIRELKPFVLRCYAIKSKCQQQNLEYNLTPEYLEGIWTGRCAISGVPLDHRAGRGQPNTAELDRVVPHKGYVTGNVSWVSHRMNRIKDNASAEEIKMILSYLESNGQNV